MTLASFFSSSHFQNLDGSATKSIRENGVKSSVVDKEDTPTSTHEKESNGTNFKYTKKKRRRLLLPLLKRRNYNKSLDCLTTTKRRAPRIHRLLHSHFLFGVVAFLEKSSPAVSLSRTRALSVDQRRRRRSLRDENHEGFFCRRRRRGAGTSFFRHAIIIV